MSLLIWWIKEEATYVEPGVGLTGGRHKGVFGSEDQPALWTLVSN